jgi:hypothetical protein
MLLMQRLLLAQCKLVLVRMAVVKVAVEAAVEDIHAPREDFLVKAVEDILVEAVEDISDHHNILNTHNV